jgi:acyl-CoA synthetase (AMP-forming)/AMP-acid ligase II
MILSTILAENARIHRRRPAVLDDDGMFTWSDFADRVARAAGVLRSLGLRRGERFALVMRNGFRQAELLWAGYWSGIIPVPVNWRLSPGEIAEILEDAGCRLIAVEEEFVPLLESPALAAWHDRVLRVETERRPEGVREGLSRRPRRCRWSRCSNMTTQSCCTRRHDRAAQGRSVVAPQHPFQRLADRAGERNPNRRRVFP